MEIPLMEIGECYGRLRLICPGAEGAMLASLRQYGQLMPVVVCRGEKERYEMIDGFKRLRAARQLDGFTRLKARCLDGSPRVFKAAIVHLGGMGQGIQDLEEALGVQSLHREDGLTQVEIATLLGRHKSWVCRRIALIERRLEEVFEHIRLGLIPASIGRELVRLPRGNQKAALEAVTRYRLSRRETEGLVSLLLRRPGWEHETILRCPEAMMGRRAGSPSHLGDPRWGRHLSRLYSKLLAMERCCVWVAQEMDLWARVPLTSEEYARLRPVMARAIEAAERVLDPLKQTQACGSIQERLSEKNT